MVGSPAPASRDRTERGGRPPDPASWLRRPRRFGCSRTSRSPLPPGWRRSVFREPGLSSRYRMDRHRRASVLVAGGDRSQLVGRSRFGCPRPTATIASPRSRPTGPGGRATGGDRTQRRETKPGLFVQILYRRCAGRVGQRRFVLILGRAEPESQNRETAHIAPFSVAGRF